MKKTLTILLLFLAFGLQKINAQQKDLTQSFNNYIEATKSDNISNRLDYFHPSTFDYISKDTLIMVFEMIKLNPMIKVGNEKLISISDIYSDNNIQYALLAYSHQITMDVSNLKVQGGDNYAITLMTKELKSHYGEENVRFNEKLYKMEVSITNYLYAIRDPKYKGWKFSPKDEEYTDLNEQIIPETIREKI